MHARALLLTVGTLVLGAVVPAAHAFDLTGHWIGKYTCKGYDGTRFSLKSEQPADFTQIGSEVRFHYDDGNDFVFIGLAIPDAKKPDEKGEVMLVECSNTNDPTVYSEIVRAQVRTKQEKGKGTFSGVSLYVDGEAGTCKYKYKRLDTINPGLGACP